MIKIENGGHTGLRAKDFNLGFALGKTTHDISFNDVMWALFITNRKNN
ncbi:hypothetical protein [Patiriisocius sp. Uisw_017]